MSNTHTQQMNNISTPFLFLSFFECLVSFPPPHLSMCIVCMLLCVVVRPYSPILTVTSSEQTARQSLVTRGLFPLLVGSMIGSDSLINRVLAAAQRLGLVRPGDLAVVTSGSREATAGATNGTHTHTAHEKER